jgi:hypothetical protein
MIRILKKLETAGLFDREQPLRRRAYSYLYHSCACIFTAAGEHRTALWNSMRSFAWYPLPSPDVQQPLERLRRMAAIVRRILRQESAAGPRPAAASN